MAVIGALFEWQRKRHRRALFMQGYKQGHADLENQHDKETYEAGRMAAITGEDAELAFNKWDLDEWDDVVGGDPDGDDDDSVDEDDDDDEDD